MFCNVSPGILGALKNIDSILDTGINKFLNLFDRMEMILKPTDQVIRV